MNGVACRLQGTFREVLRHSARMHNLTHAYGFRDRRSGNFLPEFDQQIHLHALNTPVCQSHFLNTSIGMDRLPANGVSDPHARSSPKRERSKLSQDMTDRSTLPTYNARSAISDTLS